MAIVVSGNRAESGKIHDNVLVAAGGRLTLDGMIVGSLRVASGGYAHVRGLVQGLVVESGGSARLDGMCVGDVHNMGGDLVIAGMVTGEFAWPNVHRGRARFSYRTRVLGDWVPTRGTESDAQASNQAWTTTNAKQYEPKAFDPMIQPGQRRRPSRCDYLLKAQCYQVVGRCGELATRQMRSPKRPPPLKSAIANKVPRDCSTLGAHIA